MKLSTFRRLFLASVGALILACAAPEGLKAVPGQGVQVQIEIPGSGSGRGLWDDAAITKVTVIVKNATHQVGSGDLMKGDAANKRWYGTLNVSSTGNLTFTALAQNNTDQVVYTGSSSANILGDGSDSVSITVAGATLVSVVSPASGGTEVSVRDSSGAELLEFKFQFSASLDTSASPGVEFTQPPRLLKAGANPGKVGFPLETEAAFTYSTTVYPNDTVTVKPLYGYGSQTYSAPVLKNFRRPGGGIISDQSVPGYTVATAALPMTRQVSDWRERVMYFALTDRFNDGDSSNNQFITTGDLDHVAEDGKTYQGGDYAGMRAKLDYLQNLGVTALWITAPVRQAWENATFTSYHGYWAQDFYAVDPHLGTMKDLRDLVKDAHARGMAVILDVVVNHVGSLGWYDLNSNNIPDTGEWEPAFSSSTYGTFKWLEEASPALDYVTRANRLKPYFGPLPTGKTLFDFLTRKGGDATTGAGDAITQGDFAGLRDVNTGDTAVRQRLTDIFKWWIANTDIDGFRIDTVKHVDSAFWTSFCSDLRSYAAGLTTTPAGGKAFYTVAEIYDGSPSGLGAFTGSGMLDSVLGFNMAEEVFDWNSGENITLFKDTGSWSARPRTAALEAAHTGLTGTTSLNQVQTNSDGNSARQKIGYFLDNHDLNRFLNGTSTVANEAPSAGEITNLQMALGWLLTWEGIPTLYYATEQNYKQTLALSSGGEHGNGAGNVNKGNRPNLWQVSHSAQGSAPWNQSHSTYSLIKALAEARRTYPELGKGYAKVVWTDSDGAGADAGFLGYLRHYGATSADVTDDLLVVVNTSSQYSAGSYTSGNDMKVGGTGWGWPVGTVLVPVNLGVAGTVLNSTLYNSDGTPDADNEVATFTQKVDGVDWVAVYFKVPPNSITILRRK